MIKRLTFDIILIAFLIYLGGTASDPSVPGIDPTSLQSETFRRTDELPLQSQSARSPEILHRPSRLDNRNLFVDPPPIARPKPKCNKRIRILNGVTRFRDRGSFVRYACSHGFILIGASVAVCLRDQWSEPPPFCVKPGCRRILAPANGLARLSYAGAVADFVCKPHHSLEGNRFLFCDGSRWNGTEPVCVPEEILTTTTTEEIWEWPQPPNETENETDESWDYNQPSTSSWPSTGQPLPTTPTTASNLTTKTTASTEVTTFIKPESGSQTNTTTTTEKKVNDVNEETWKTSTSSTAKNDEVSVGETEIFYTTTPVAEITSKEVNFNTVINDSSSESPPINITEIEGQSERTTTEGNFQVPTTEISNEVKIVIPPETQPSPIPEFIQPIIQPHKFGGDNDEHYHTIIRISMIGGVLLGSLSTILLLGTIAIYCWKKNVGIAHRNVYESDGRNLSASEANDDFMWMEPNNLRDPSSSSTSRL